MFSTLQQPFGAERSDMVYIAKAGRKPRAVYAIAYFGDVDGSETCYGYYGGESIPATVVQEGGGMKTATGVAPVSGDEAFLFSAKALGESIVREMVAAFPGLAGRARVTRYEGVVGADRKVRVGS